jgi:hypothetical protein
MPFAAAARALERESIPLLALLRRDLLGGSRAAGTEWMKVAAIVLAGAAAIAALMVNGDASEFGVRAASLLALGLFCALILTGFAAAAPVAVTALRREREEGMLDLLFLAGIRPSTLVLGRTLSTWLRLELLLVASLPALALLGFFAHPSLAELALASLHLSAHFLAVAAVVVAVSAWARHAGYAVALGSLVVIGWIVVLVTGARFAWPTTVQLIAQALHVDDGAQPSPSHATGLALDGAAALLGVIAAIQGLKRRSARHVVRPREPRRLASPTLRDSPMTWLLLRRSAAARPAVQAIVVGPVALPFAFGPPEMQAGAGVALLLAGFIATVGLGATSVAPEREKRTWTSLASTRLSGLALIGDLLRGVLVASAVPVLGGLAMTCTGALGGGAHPVPALVAVAGTLVSWLLLAMSSLAASLVTRTGGALLLGGAYFLGGPALATAAALIAHELGPDALDEGGIGSWLLLVGAAAFGGSWLILRAGWRGKLRIVLAMLPALGTMLIPLILGTGNEALGAMPLVAIGAAGLAAIVHGVARDGGFAILAGILLLGSCLILPACTLGLRADEAAVAAAGGFAWLGASLSQVFGSEMPSTLSLAAGAAFHAALACAIVVAFVPRLERWIGRAA